MTTATKKRQQRKQWLTDRVLDALNPERAPYEIADAHPGTTGTGLLVRVQPSGIKSLYSSYKVANQGNQVYVRGGITRRKAGEARRVFLGRWPGDIGLIDARAAAQKHRAEAGAGRDPSPNRKPNGEAAPAGRITTLKQLAEAFRASKLSRNVENWWPTLRDIALDRWGDVAPELLTPEMFWAEVDALIKQEKFAKARVLRDGVRAMYNEMCPALRNPAAKATRGRAAAMQRKQRKNVTYTDAELRAFWEITEGWGDERTGMPGRHGLVARLALLTGVRSDVALSRLRWPNVHENRLEFDPPEEGSGKRWPLALPMTDGIRALIDAARPHKRDDTDLVFWTRRHDGVFEGASPNPRLLRERADKRLAGKTIKQLRHTATTRMADVGIRDDLLRVLTGHSGGTLDIYNKATYLEPLREALPKWEAALKKVLDAKE